jgi:hypothetical protein
MGQWRHPPPINKSDRGSNMINCKIAMAIRTNILILILNLYTFCNAIIPRLAFQFSG